MRAVVLQGRQLDSEGSLKRKGSLHVRASRAALVN
jgi:hypothetical protein